MIPVNRTLDMLDSYMPRPGTAEQISCRCGRALRKKSMLLSCILQGTPESAFDPRPGADPATTDRS